VYFAKKLEIIRLFEDKSLDIKQRRQILEEGASFRKGQPVSIKNQRLLPLIKT
jgi:hypothetical protein